MSEVREGLEVRNELMKIHHLQIGLKLVENDGLQKVSELIQMSLVGGALDVQVLPILR